MTQAERPKPELMNPGRIRRLVKGCGLKEADVQAQLKQFNQMRAMMQQLGQLFGKSSPESLNTPAPAPTSSGGFSMQMPRRQKPGKAGKSKLSKQEQLMQQLMQGKKPPQFPPGFPFK